MTAFMGADTDQLRDLSQQMALGALRLMEQQRRIVQTIHTTQWEGPDADAFRAEAMGVVSGGLVSATDDLDRRRDELGEHAAEQDEASDPRSWWEKLNDFLHLPSQITRGIRNLQKLITDPKKMMDLFRRFPPALEDYRAMKRVEDLFPNFVDDARKAWRASWFDELTGKGWEKLGSWLPSKASSMFGINMPGKEWIGKAFSGLDEAAKAADANPLLKIGSKSFGKILPGVDIALGVRQMMDPDSTTYDKISGGMSTVGGAMVLLAPLTGPAAPIVAGIGVGIGVASAAMDLGKMAYENIPVVKDTVDTVANAVGDGVKAVGDGLGKVGKAFGSLFG